MDDLLEMVVVVVALVLVGIAIFITGGIAATAYGIDRPSCYAHWESSGMQVRWSFWGNCQLSQDGKHWITDDAYTHMQKNVTVK